MKEILQIQIYFSRPIILLRERGKKVKKKPIFLLEVLIALSLTAILLTFFFSFFVQSVKIEKTLDQARMAISSRNHLQTRLQSILNSLVRGSECYFYTKQFEKESSLSLVVIFDNGIDPDPLFSGTVRGRIFIDEEKNLCLVTWPLNKMKNRPWRKEILMTSVDHFEFEFLGKKIALEKGKAHSINGELAWRTSWPKGMLEIPSLIRLRVQEKETLRFAFILPSMDPFIVYPGEKVS